MVPSLRWAFDMFDWLSIDHIKLVTRSVANDAYTLIMIALVIYALSFMCQAFERKLIRVIMLVMLVDGIMRIIAYLTT